jgi:Cd2+/Zn2+-exporting ATPase
METNVAQTSTTQSPESGTRCTDVLSDTLRGYAGIHQADFNLEDGSLKISYDPHVLNDENALHLVRRASERAYGRVNQFAARGDGACAHCTLDMHRELSQHYKKLSTILPPAEAIYNNGRMEVRLAIDGPAGLELAEAEIVPATLPVEIPLPRGFPREKLEIVLTVITLLATLLGFLAQRISFLPPTAISVLFVTAFAAGGYYGLIDGIAVLRERRLDVNLLMILAALGAAFIGQPVEGATLLFLFSLSNTLQTYAMGRSRKAIEKLLDLRPATATVRRGSRLVSLPIEKLLICDVVLVPVMTYLPAH